MKALLALEDGSLFWGESIGAAGETVGEVVFNTSMTGYQEILTDPSYFRQLVTLTYPHIGNVGVNDEDCESKGVMASGLIIRDLPLLHSSFRAKASLADYLVQQNVVAIADIDTRELTRVLREKGAQNGVIVAADNIDADAAVAKAKAFAGLNGMDLAIEVTTKNTYTFREGEWSLNNGFQTISDNALPYHVVAYDYGVKTNILRMLTQRGCRLTIVPADTPAQAVIAMNPDGIFLSNGPGDPAACHYAIEAIAEHIQGETPIYGICLGHQLLALAAGAKTLKMKFGHHGGNHPVQDMRSGKVLITAQNHGFAVDEASLPSGVEATHRSLFDQSNQGIRFTNKPFFSFQGHPEASPGPHDLAYLFDEFIANMAARRA
ncbi:MAG: glutamine-hydrolyzing carbamoyl-phosphate synthase small subunit [Thiotrichales bacterium]|jgi:carbamoyl-phosphate synthase small subunit|nr:glutamine-hydrolyzing carbamoyl-phosphate synthase small subunit [Thiotrichales bacterium]